MRFELSALKDFRGIEDGRREWGPGINLILGPNGAGKTNLLESIAILTGWGPFSGYVRGTISWDCGATRAWVGGKISGDDDERANETHEITVQLSSRMTPRVDGYRASCTDLRLLSPSIVFLPADIDLIDGSPSLRRAFINRLCALYYPPYARRLSDFRRVVRHRTALLRQGKSPGITSLPFAQLGGWIMEARRRLVSNFASQARSGFDFSLSMVPEIDMNVNGAEYLLSALKDTLERETHAMRPLVGPGRDDVEISVNIAGNSRPASECLSRGQKRRLVLSLILTAGRLIESRLRKKPVLLFDDLAAELDAENRKLAGKLLSETGWQVFVTGTENPFGDDSKFAIHNL